ncbi:MAG: hypothetical protein EOL95_10050 [Bacteroidia bacterium]|nr:hypothetical protein [Bacteroidia bacterium]
MEHRIFTRLCFFLLIIPCGVVAQGKFPIKNVHGTARIKMEDEWGREYTKQKALEEAKLDALYNCFGEQVHRESNYYTNSDHGDSFVSRSSTNLRGVWIKTCGEPKYTEDTEVRNGINEIYITCHINGKARKLPPLAEINTKFLKCPNLNCEAQSYRFFDLEKMYLYFVSAADGYLSIFLQENDQVYRILPSEAMCEKKMCNAAKVIANKEYFLFDNQQQPPYFDVTLDPLELFLPDGYNEILNTIIIVFTQSKQSFSAPPLDAPTYDHLFEGYIPSTLTAKEFNKWIGDQKMADPMMQLKYYPITITNK